MKTTSTRNRTAPPLHLPVPGAQQCATASTEPAQRQTVQSELVGLFNELVGCGEEIAALEQALIPATYEGGVGSCEDKQDADQPELIRTVRGLRSAVQTYNARLANLRSRLVV